MRLGLGDPRLAAKGLLAVALVACADAGGAPVRPAPARDAWIGDGRTPPAPTAAPAPIGRDVAAEGHDFGPELRLLARVVACAGDAPLPPGLDAAVVAEHCAALAPVLAAYRARWLDVARPFLAGVVPKDAPRRVVYPFSGGDLVSALATYPDAEEYTTISLELAGDPRRLRGLSRGELAQSLHALRADLDELLGARDYSRSETLKTTQRGDIPGVLAFFAVGLALAGMEPAGLRFFRLDAEGEVRWLADEDIAALDRDDAVHRKATWTPPDFSEAFASCEITFRVAGELRVHRHLAVNLSDATLSRDPALLRHLEAKGRVAAMTKAASYLLWQDGFSLVRDYLVAHADVIVSDSTGVPPGLAPGLELTAFGAYEGSLLRASTRHDADLRRLFSRGPRRPLPFTYGYRDARGHAHLLVARRNAP